MTDATLQKALKDAVEEVLEKMFFIRTDGEPPDPDGTPTAPRESDIVALLAFEGHPSGTLVLSVARATARSIAADFLGDEEDALSGGQVEEVICELANMICGSVLSRVESKTTFRLESPCIVSHDQPKTAESMASGTPPGANRFQLPGATVHVVEIRNGALTVLVNTGRPACSTVEEFEF